ncbi:polysaccharide deacetylase family protein [Geomesophilobacter sediminis]|uniref:Polysaccharide deacetylase family protein n=1 Tax=Geomesophilobacter sediminis TaxID=2798584 RepID=A0A8J7SAG1_9BACT|nr:polysaccharide deacetylase family protein [Geomesophilobacter sediminis]MBJ6727311.1 polysaccharide deacetylase family protein [Geomesophilobacter sediminis]
MARRAVFTPIKTVLNRIDPPVLVLLYHRVTTLPEDPELLAVTPENFRAHLGYLAEHFPIVRFEEDWDAVSKPAVCITFDDGYADNLLEALPILDEFQVPATFFVSTGPIATTGGFWWDELHRILVEHRELPGELTLPGVGKGFWPTRTAAERERLYGELVPYLVAAPTGHREEIRTEIRRWSATVPGCDDRHRPLTVEELRRFAANRLVTIGAHTVTHSRLSALSEPAQREEILASKRQLEQWLGGEVSVFSYPYGRRCHYNRDSIALCREAGFRKVASNFPGQAHRWTDPYQVPRHLVRNWHLAEFVPRLRAFWTR